MRILFLSSWLPFPPDNGSKIRILNLLRSLSRQHEITLISWVSQHDHPENLEPLQALCRRVILTAAKLYRPRSQRALLGFFSTMPRSLFGTYDVEMAQSICREVARVPHDVLIASQLNTIPYARLVPQLPKIFEEAELTVLKDAYDTAPTVPQRLRRGMTWWKLKRFVQRSLLDFSACTVVSEAEKRHLQTLLPDMTIEVMPNGIDIASYVYPSPDSAVCHLIYPGAMTYGANLDAVAYFLEAIYPRIRQRLPQVTFCVTGDYSGVPLSTLRLDTSVTLTGYVGDVHPLIASSTVCVVPLRVGGGSRLKILEAMTLGTPVVATPKGAEGLHIQHGRHCLIAESPEDFAHAVHQICLEPALRARLSIAARELVTTRYDWEAIGQRYTRWLHQMLGAACRN